MFPAGLFPKGMYKMPAGKIIKELFFQTKKPEHCFWLNYLKALCFSFSAKEKQQKKTLSPISSPTNFQFAR